ncbi:hypothetical protein Tco_0665347 [Tanacetum coccineum]
MKCNDNNSETENFFQNDAPHSGNNNQGNEGICRVDKFEVIKYSIGDNEEFMGILTIERDSWDQTCLTEYLASTSISFVKRTKGGQCTEPTVMSSTSSAVTYTSVYTDSEPGRPHHHRIYIPDSEEPHTPPVPQDKDERGPMFIQPHDPDYVPEPIYPEYILLEDVHEFSVKEQPLPHAQAMRVREFSTARPTDRSRSVDLWVDRQRQVPEDSNYDSGSRDSRTRISQRVTMESQRVNLLMGDRMTLQETMQQAEMAELRETDRKPQAQMIETLRMMRDMRQDMGDMQAELLALREQRRRARQPAPDARVLDHQDASKDADSHI